VPFYDWQFWIDKTLDRVYFEQKYRDQNKNRRKSVKDPKRDVQYVRYLSNYEYIGDHF